MLRVGLTGGLGSGKSTVAAMLRDCGAHVIEADAVGRALMEPGRPVFAAVVEHFGKEIVRADGTLDRRKLADLSFQQGRVHELSLIVHPAVIAAQETWMKELFAREPAAVAVIESALIFEAERDGTVPGWRDRFDTLILVTAPRELRIERFLQRAGAAEDPAKRASLRADAESRIASQIADEEKVPLCDIVLENTGSVEDMRLAVQKVWANLAAQAASQPATAFATQAQNWQN
jgi:dephospho-CoA kinase